MPDDGPLHPSVRERLAVVETLLETVIRSVEKLIVTVESLSQRENQDTGRNQVTSRLDSAVIAAGAGLASAIVTMFVSFLLHR
jgi:biopolymer transport protein ExbB/TolQ